MADTEHTPTPEQDEAIGLFLSRQNLVVEAGAGTGKTSTLVMMAELDRSRRGQYVAFNKAIVLEAGTKMPRSVDARTAHSLAARATRGRPDGDRLMSRLSSSSRRSSARDAAYLGLDPLKIKLGDSASYLTPGYLAGVVNRAIAAFCNSADPAPARHHVAYIEGIDMPDAEGRLTYTNNNLVRDAVTPTLRKAWADLTRPDGHLRFTHDVYIKMWEQSSPHIAADFVMFDEAQDASPVMLSIVAQQDTHAQLIYVGDTQQQIYGWRGAINALDSLDDAERTWLTQSFRFGPAIAEIANDCLEQIEAPLRLQGLETLASVVEPIDMPRATLCRTNAEAVGRVISALQAGRRPYLVGEGVEVVRFARAVEQLRETGSTSHPELACFTSWGQVQDYVDQDPQGSDLALLVRLVEQFGTETIISALSNPRPEESCDEVVSTAHKAKGREWETVTLAGDFPEPTERELTTEEWRLLYVAVTRAQLGLDISGVAALTGSMPGRVDVEVPDTLPVADAADARMDEAYGYRRPPLG